MSNVSVMADVMKYYRLKKELVRLNKKLEQLENSNDEDSFNYIKRRIIFDRIVDIQLEIAEMEESAKLEELCISLG